MNNTYIKDSTNCKLVKAKPETIEFLLSFSKALDITEAQGMKFENNLN